MADANVPLRTSPSHPTRRALLAGAAAAPALALPASTRVEAAPDPHPAWFAEWRALVDWYNGPDADPAADCPQQHPIIALEGLAAATPARPRAGALPHLPLPPPFLGEYGSLGSGGNDGALLDSALATLERLSGEEP